MTFEARDSAAKIVPARFRKPFPEKQPQAKEEEPGIRHTSAQTKWENNGVYGKEHTGKRDDKEVARRAMTSAFIKFSKTLTSVESSCEYYNQQNSQNLIKCPSAPSLVREFLQEDKRQAGMEAPRILRVCAPRPQVRRLSTNVLPRQTMSVDNPAIREVYTAAIPGFIGEGSGDEEMELGASATAVDQVEEIDPNLALDLHLPQCAVTLMVRDNNSRSPSSKATMEEESIVAGGTSTFEQDTDSACQSSLTRVCEKVDKQTSTADYYQLNTLGWSKDVSSSREGSFSNRTTTGGSFKEAKRSRSSKKVRRSETIDTASHHPRKHHNHHHLSQHLHSSRRSSSSRSMPSGKPSSDGRKLVNMRSETGRRHQLLRQPKIEAGSSHEHIEVHGPYNV